jgi:hypothetical protein
MASCALGPEMPSMNSANSSPASGQHGVLSGSVRVRRSSKHLEHAVAGGVAEGVVAS